MVTRITLVKFIKSYGNQYVIQFPNLKEPLTIDRYFYEKMVRSPEKFKFV